MSKIPNGNKQLLSKPKTTEEMMLSISQLKSPIDPDIILKRANNDIDKCKNAPEKFTIQSNIFKAMTLLEYENGTLMITIIPEQYYTFGLDMMRKLIKEYKCTLISEKALAELATVSYIRTLEIQRRINNYLDLNTITDNGAKFLAIMSKELDRANRHYITAIQTLQMFNQPPLNIMVKTQTANIGNQQLIQENNNVKSK